MPPEFAIFIYIQISSRPPTGALTLRYIVSDDVGLMSLFLTLKTFGTTIITLFHF